MDDLCSVIILTFNTNIKKIYMTLDSILLQSYKNLEIIIGDDGSINNHFEELKEYLENKNFYNYKLLGDGINRGTVINLYSSVNSAKGLYIKVIGAGDILFDEHVLEDMFLHMKNTNAKIAFGHMKQYQYLRDNALAYKDYIGPKDIEAFIKNKENRIAKNIVVYGKYLSGASMFFETKFLLDSLEEIKGKVVYCEDLIQILAIIHNVKIEYLPRYVVWYEYGEGISTCNSSKWKQRLEQDQNVFRKHLVSNYGDNGLVKRYNTRKKLNKYNKVVRGIIKILLFNGTFIADVKTYIQKKKGFYSVIPEQGFLSDEVQKNFSLK